MSTGPQSNLTILFEAPFWIGLYERTDNGKYEVCKITFGSEPKNYEVYEFLLKNWHKLMQEYRHGVQGYSRYLLPLTPQ